MPPYSRDLRSEDADPYLWNGSHVFTSEETSFQPTPKVEVADTVGAGDSFTGAFISEAHKRAVEVSAYVCTQNGAMPVLPAELLA